MKPELCFSLKNFSSLKYCTEKDLAVLLSATYIFSIFSTLVL